MSIPEASADPQLSPRLGGPGSAFRPYASSENLFEPSLFPSSKPPISNGHSEKITKRHSTSSLKPPKIMESDEDFFRPKPRQLRAPIMSTTDTEPEMKEFNLGPIGGEKKGKKHQKAFYSTSETEEEYQAYLKSKPKWHGKGGHKDSWDPLQIASPPQIVQQQVQPLGVVQKPVPQAKPSTVKIERGAQLSAAYIGSLTDQQLHEAYLRQAGLDREMFNLAPPEKLERIQKSDSIIEMRQKTSLSSDRIQKSTSVIEVIPSNINKAVSMSPKHFKDLSVISEANKHSTEHQFLGQQQAKSTTNLSMSSSNMLQLPQVSSPPDSEDQTTPQAPRKPFLPNQTSVDSVNSFSEPEESNENLAPQLKSNKEDPETKKKKEIHKNLMSEALKKVELKNHQKKTFSQLSRTNPGIAALDIETRKELKMGELANKQEQEKQEFLRNRKRSGSSKVDDSLTAPSQPGVNLNVLNSFRQQSIHKGTSTQQNSASREASIQAKKAGTPGKPDVIPRRTEVQSPPAVPLEPVEPPVVILKKQPRILDTEELKARQRMDGKSTPNIEMRSAAVRSPEINNVPAPSKNMEKQATVSTKKVDNSVPVPVVKKQERVINDIHRQDSLKKTSNEKESHAVKAAEKVTVAQQKMHNTEQKLSAKQSLQGLIQVKPKNPESGKVKPEIRTEDDHKLKKNINNEENNSKIASVKKAAEKYENKTVQLEGGNNPNSHLRLRSKSISNARKEQFAEAALGSPKAAAKGKGNLPWAAKSPPVLRKRDAHLNKGYALQLSKSSDSITAAKLLAKARAENNNNSGLRINQNFSKSIEKQIDVYSKTKEEIRMILSLAKSGSVVDRVNLFSNMTTSEPAQPDLNAKAESIRREIEEARAQAHETVSDTEIEFQEPIESKVKPLKIPMKPKIIDNSDLKNKGSPESSLRINQSSSSEVSKERRTSVEELPSVKSKISNYLSAAEDSLAPPQFESKPKPILVNKTERSSKERSKSPRKKTPRLVSDHYLTPSQSFQIYAQSATDMSATEDEAEAKLNSRKISMPAKLPSQDPGPYLLRVPNKNAKDQRPTGLTKSKSFATPGQFECSIDNEEISSKKETMMAFFGTSNPTGLKSIMKKTAPKAVRRSSLSSITDEAVAEEDLVDIDAEFESLLNSTFEKESLKASHPVEGKGYGAAGRGGPVNKQTGKLQKSQSFSTAALVHNAELRSDQLIGDQSVISDTMQQINQSMRAGFDPVAALPSSQGRRKGGAGGTPPPHSPSPTQSEYDTADPWDDY